MPDILTNQFIGQNLHFGVNLFAALACLAAGWLYLDAWAERHRLTELIKGSGFLLLAAGFLVTGAAWGGEPGLLGLVATAFKLGGYLGVIVSNSPMQRKPKTTTGYTPAPAVWLPTAGLSAGSGVLLPLAALCVSLLYWRIATRGLERHLKPLALAFATFTVSEALALAAFWRASTNPLLQPLTAPLGPLWILEHLTLLAGSLLLARWVWRYLTKRLIGQLFLMITSLTFAIVLLATTSVSALLLGSLQSDSLSSLTTASKVLSYAVDSKTAESRTSTEILAENPDVIAATIARDHTTLATLASAALVRKKLSEVILTDEAGLVLARASDPDRAGDSLSNNPLVQRALGGDSAASITAHASTLAPTLVITTASPITSHSQIIGVATASLALDNAFVDGLKHTTNLDSTIYSGATRAATTLTGPDGASRSVGATETNAQIIDTVLKHGQIWQGLTNSSSQPYLAVYLPLKDVNNTVVGMLSVAQAQDVVLSSAKQAVKLTFAGAAAALLVIMLPVFILARQISRQIH